MFEAMQLTERRCVQTHLHTFMRCTGRDSTICIDTDEVRLHDGSAVHAARSLLSATAKPRTLDARQVQAARTRYAQNHCMTL